MDRKGYFFEPTIFTDVTDSMWIAEEESFGPILIILKFDGDVEKVRSVREKKEKSSDLDRNRETRE